MSHCFVIVKNGVGVETTTNRSNAGIAFASEASGVCYKVIFFIFIGVFKKKLSEFDSFGSKVMAGIPLLVGSPMVNCTEDLYTLINRIFGGR